MKGKLSLPTPRAQFTLLPMPNDDANEILAIGGGDEKTPYNDILKMTCPRNGECTGKYWESIPKLPKFFTGRMAPICMWIPPSAEGCEMD